MEHGVRAVLYILHYEVNCKQFFLIKVTVHSLALLFSTLFIFYVYSFVSLVSLVAIWTSLFYSIFSRPIVLVRVCCDLYDAQFWSTIRPGLLPDHHHQHRRLCRPNDQPAMLFQFHILFGELLANLISLHTSTRVRRSHGVPNALHYQFYRKCP